MLLWSEQFATGSPDIDAQHRTLIDNINQLEIVLGKTNPNREECEFIVGLVNFLQSYTEKHFQFEEQCMENFRCPAREKNKLAHESFLEMFRRFQEHYQREGFRPELLANLHQTMSEWIRQHILLVDVQLRHCLKHGNPQ